MTSAGALREPVTLAEQIEKLMPYTMAYCRFHVHPFVTIVILKTPTGDTPLPPIFLPGVKR